MHLLESLHAVDAECNRYRHRTSVTRDEIHQGGTAAQVHI